MRKGSPCAGLREHGATSGLCYIGGSHALTVGVFSQRVSARTLHAASFEAKPFDAGSQLRKRRESGVHFGDNGELCLLSSSSR
jgi:hypothetical protein